MKSSELRGQSEEQLASTLADTEKHLFQLRFQSATDRLETPSEISKAKQLIARIHTERRRRELEALGQTDAAGLAALEADLAAKSEAAGPGKRRVRRNLARVLVLQGKPPAPPAKGK